MDYGCQLYNTASAGRIKKLDSIHREGIRIYTGAFRTSPVETLHAEANDPSLKLRRNELGWRYLYKQKITHTQNLKPKSFQPLRNFPRFNLTFVGHCG